MSLTLVYDAPGHDLSQLRDELLVAGLAPERVEGEAVEVLVPQPDGQTLETRVDRVTLTMPDGTDEGEVDAVVAAHVPRTRYDPAVRLQEVGALLRASGRAALQAQVRRATTVGDLRAALLEHLREEDGETR